MKKILFLLVCFVGFLLGQSAVEDYGACNSITLNSERYSEYFYGKNGLEHKEMKTKLTFIISGLSSDNPYISANNEKGILAYVPTADKHFYLMEITAGGNIVLYTIFTDTKKFTMTKQYNMFGNAYTSTVFGSYNCVK